ncbi:MAG: hypothetical protein LBC38_02190 [Oscillospiraceae bacterium]|jgi:Gpi18-like mannosyltransferase|nr:hypothetical protein [Oscillospiraceae bacterium]
MGTNKVLTGILLALYAAAVFFCTYSLDFSGIGTSVFITALIVAALITVCVLLKRDGLCRDFMSMITVMAPVGALLLARISLFDFITNDYSLFLHPWYETLKASDGLAGLSQNIGNYNIPYLTWLAIFTYIPVHDLYLIKMLSVIFDVILAYFLFKITAQITDSPWAKVICLTAALILPTVFINSAIWGQCDSIYAALIAAALYFAIRKPKAETDPRYQRRRIALLRNNSIFVYILAAMAFSFKLQAVFVFPIFIALVFTKRISLKYFWLFPLTYLVSVSPALLAGKSFTDTMLIYVAQQSGNSGLNYNSPSLFSLRWEWEKTEMWSQVGTLLAFIFALLILIIAAVKRSRLSNLGIVTIAVLFAVGVPLILPHMHERYFILGEVLILPLACAKPKLSPLVILTAFAALLGYHAYLFMAWFVLFNRWYLTMNYGFWALAIVVVTLFVEFLRMDRKSNTLPPSPDSTASIPIEPNPYASRRARRNSNNKKRRRNPLP